LTPSAKIETEAEDIRSADRMAYLVSSKPLPIADRAELEAWFGREWTPKHAHVMTGDTDK